MLKRIIFVLLAGCLLFSISMAMPPHPDLLKKIQNGEVLEPVFISDPGYRDRAGIDQGLPEPLLEPRTALTNVNFLAILVGFSDRAGIMPTAYFDSLVFGVNPGPWGPTLRNFYNRASYGNFTIVSVNYPSSTAWRAAPNNRRYYTAQGGTTSYGMGTYPNNSQGLCEWVVANVDPLINFANYDNNGDGQVDGIIIIHAGRGAEVSGDTLDIWSHAWTITPQLRDGVTISSYCIVPEIWNSAYDMTIGVYCHEFGHVLGLPDLYDYGYDSYGLGSWSLMAYGSWNGNGWGFSPAFLDAWSRVFLGFVIPTNLNCNAMSVVIPPVVDSARVYRLWTNGIIGSEYFLVENRSRIYTDTALVAAGLHIYHVDDVQSNNDNQWWPGLPPTLHYKVALEQADNLYNLEHYANSMDSGDPYPGITANFAFNDATFPWARSYLGALTQVGVNNILPGGPPNFIQADLIVGGAGTIPAMLLLWYPLTGYAFNNDAVSFGWQPDPNSATYHFQLDNDSLFGSPLIDNSTLPTNNFAYSFLGRPDGPYYWRVRGIGCGPGPWCATQRIFRDTQAPYGIIASSPPTAYSSSFVVNWTPGTDPPPSSGMRYYFVYGDSGSGYFLFHMDSTLFSWMYTGARDGKKYRFFAIGQDQAPNVEYWDGSTYECSTQVVLSGGGCHYVVGDANGSNTFTGLDITYSVRFFKGGPPPSYSCECPTGGGNFWYVAGDVNGSCTFTGLDITYMVRYFKGGPGPIPCPSCPPARR